MITRREFVGNHGDDAPAKSIDGADHGHHCRPMFTFGLAGGAQAFDPLALLLVALAIEAVVGEARIVFRVLPHPVAVIAGLTGVLDRKLNRQHRSQRDRAMRGALVVVAIISASLALGWGVARLSRVHPWGSLAELVLLVALLAQRKPYNQARAVERALRRNGLARAREAVSSMTGLPAGTLDAHGTARHAIESVAERFCDGVVAPAFWYVLFGFPGLLTYKAVDVMDGMIGHPTPHYGAFGFTAARLIHVLDLIAARLAGLFIALAAAFVPTARPATALKTMLRDAGKRRSASAGWPQGAVAGALDLALGGTRHAGGGTVREPWLGDGRAAATAQDIRRALYLYAVACLINAMWVAALVIVRLDYLR